MWGSAELFGLGAAGALSFEILRAYEMYGKVRTNRFKVIYYSPLFWVVTSGMILVSGFLALAINSGITEASMWQVVISGIGARSLVSKPLEIRAAHGQTP